VAALLPSCPRPLLVSWLAYPSPRQQLRSGLQAIGIRQKGKV